MRVRAIWTSLLIWLLLCAGALASPRVFTVAGSGDRNGATVGGAATDVGGSFGPVSAMPDGGFLVTAGDSVVRKVDAHGRITRVAGTGRTARGGDGGLATRTPLGGVLDVAALPKGGFLLTEGPALLGDADYRVRRVDTRGIITTVAHVRAEALAPLKNGGFLAATGYDGRVLRVDAGGRVTTVAGVGREPTDPSVVRTAVDGVPATTVKLDIPHALAALPGGGFLIAEQHRVRRVDARGIIRTVAGGGRWRLGDGRNATDVALSPGGIAVLPDGGFLVADTANERVRRVSSRGVISTLAGASQTVQRGRVIFSPYPPEARWAGLTYDLGGSLRAARFSVSDLTLRPDGTVLVSGIWRVVGLTTGPRPPLAVALRPPTVRRGIVGLRVAASRPGRLRVEMLRARGGSRAALVTREVPAGVSTLALPHLPHGALVVRVTLRDGASIATDRTAIYTGTMLPVALARAAVASLCCGGGPAVSIGRSAQRAQESPTPEEQVQGCRRFSSTRVDCAWGFGPKECQTPYAITLRGPLVYMAQYICRAHRPALTRRPNPITPPIVAPLL